MFLAGSNKCTLVMMLTAKCHTLCDKKLGGDMGPFWLKVTTENLSQNSQYQAEILLDITKSVLELAVFA
jgi:hypothetical protein